MSRDNEGNVLDLDRISEPMIRNLKAADLKQLFEELLAADAIHRKEFALQYYEPASDDCDQVHLSDARVRFVGGGNGSGKSETSMIEGVMMLTGIVPPYLLEKYPEHNWKKRMRGPCRGRIVLQSLTGTWPVIKKKLCYADWAGTDTQGAGPRGHWGWIPKICLIGGSWEKSWTEKTRTLRVLYRNPDNIEEVMGESELQIHSYDVPAENQASGDLHFVIFDEPPPEDIYTENEARCMRVGGWLQLAMTWPDDPAINVDYLFDLIYDRCQPGPNKMKGYEAFRLRTAKNQHIEQAHVTEQRLAWDAKKVAVRQEGMPIRFSNRVHALFTNTDMDWCFSCGEPRPVSEGQCGICSSTDVCRYNHVMDLAPRPEWPVYWVLDPHPRKAHVSAYIAITPSDDWWFLEELECKGTAQDMAILCAELEAVRGYRVVRRLMDPNMAGSASQPTVDRDRTWQDDFSDVGLYCDAADKSDVGRKTVDEMLRPDPDTRMPRLIFLAGRSDLAQLQMSRFSWDDHKAHVDKSQKQKVKEKHDDVPALLRYFANDQPRFANHELAPRIIQAGGVRRYPSRSQPWVRT